MVALGAKCFACLHDGGKGVYQLEEVYSEHALCRLQPNRWPLFGRVLQTLLKNVPSHGPCFRVPKTTKTHTTHHGPLTVLGAQG